MALLTASDGADPTCHTGSGQVCKLSDTDPTIYKCDIPTWKHEVQTFNEGETIKLLAVGDKSGYGCSFEIKDKTTNVTCCYIHEEREDNRGKRLCGAAKQPEECRQPGSGEYEVEELDGPVGGPVGWCKLTLPDAKLSNAGVYKINFPFEPARYNQEMTVKVIEVDVNQAEASWLTLGLVLLSFCFMLVAVLGCCCLRTIWENRNKHNQEIAKHVFDKLKKEDADGFKTALGNTDLLRLWDRNGNNIFHLAARPSWTENMTNIVLGKAGTDVEAPLHQYTRTAIFNIGVKDQLWASRIARWYVTHVNKLFWSPKLPRVIAHLNSRNAEGDTPLMIAAGKLQTDTVKALVETGEVEINLENKGRTALHKAVNACPTQRSTYTCSAIVKYLLEKGATPKGFIDGHTPLHTAVRKGARDLVLFLTMFEGKISVLKIKSKDDKEETAFQLAVRLGEDRHTIVDFLKDYDNSWKANKGEIMKTVYPAVAGGHKRILKTLMDNAKIEWNDFSGDCLMRAVGENNKTAVNYLYGKNLTPPSDNDRQRALELAKENRRAFDIGGKVNKEKCAQQIIDKLVTAAEEESVCKKETGALPKVNSSRSARVDSPRGEYMELIKKIKRKSNKEVLDDMEQDLRQMADILQKIKDVGRKRSLDTSPSSRAAGFSSTKHSQSVSKSNYNHISE